MFSKHSALVSRILGINRNNDVIFPLVTNMRRVGLSVERRKVILSSGEDTSLLISQQREQKKLFGGENCKKNRVGV